MAKIEFTMWYGTYSLLVQAKISDKTLNGAYLNYKFT